MNRSLKGFKIRSRKIVMACPGIEESQSYID